MLGILSKYIKEVSVLRKLLFAVMFLPEDLPDRWGTAIQFAYSGQTVPGISPMLFWLTITNTKRGHFFRICVLVIKTKTILCIIQWH